MGYVTCDTFWGVNILSKVQCLIEFINYEGVRRTARTLGLSNIKINRAITRE